MQDEWDRVHQEMVVGAERASVTGRLAVRAIKVIGHWQWCIFQPNGIVNGYDTSEHAYEYVRILLRTLERHRGW
jgi:hypothetical protein